MNIQYLQNFRVNSQCIFYQNWYPHLHEQESGGTIVDLSRSLLVDGSVLL